VFSSVTGSGGGADGRATVSRCRKTARRPLTASGLPTLIERDWLR